MKAALVTKFGPPNVITIKDNYEIPKITKPTQVLVRMHATSINPGDDLVRSGFAKILGSARPPFVTGNDGSGVVTSVGEGVTKFKVGDEVYGEISFARCGCAAQYCLWEEKELAFKPKKMSFVQAASLPVVGQTSYQGLTTKGQLKAGERVLIIGSAGGIGSFSVQYAKAIGAYVVGVCSTANVDYVKTLGADQVIDYKTQKFKEVLSKEEDKVDMVFDTIGDKNCQSQAFQVLKRTGRYVTASMGLHSIFSVISGWLRISQPYIIYMSSPNVEVLAKIAALVDEGKIKANEIREMPLESIVEAHTEVSKLRGRGKIVIKIP